MPLFVVTPLLEVTLLKLSMLVSLLMVALLLVVSISLFVTGSLSVFSLASIARSRMEIAKVSFGKGTDYRELVVGLIVHESGIVDCGRREDSEGPQGRQSGNLDGITTAAK